MFVAIKQGNYTKAISFLDYNPEDVNQWCDKEERTALIHCAFIKEEGKGVGLATALLQTGARVATRDKYGLNTLHYACINQRVQLVSVLLNSLDCHVNAKCKRTGNTALHFTATNGNSNIARQLIQQLKRYHLSMEVKNRDGLTPLQVAVQAESHEVVQLLVEAGAERSVCVVSPFPPEPSDGATNSQSASSSSDRRSNSVESSSTSRVIALRQERNRLKPMIAPLRTKPSKPKPQICLKLRPVIVKHVGFVDRTELSRLDSLRGLAMNGKRQARSAELAASSTWRETLPVMWTKYSQQYRFVRPFSQKTH